MHKTDIEELIHEHINDVTNAVITSIPGIKVVTKVDEAIKARGLTGAKLAKLTGLRPTTISELIKGNRQMISKTHIVSLMIALRITDIREIIDIELDPETIATFEKEAEEWIKTKKAPESINQLYRKNVKAMAEQDTKI